MPSIAKFAWRLKTPQDRRGADAWEQAGEHTSDLARLALPGKGAGEQGAGERYNAYNTDNIYNIYNIANVDNTYNIDNAMPFQSARRGSLSRASRYSGDVGSPSEIALLGEMPGSLSFDPV